jgi:hypothetical protein
VEDGWRFGTIAGIADGGSTRQRLRGQSLSQRDKLHLSTMRKIGVADGSMSDHYKLKRARRMQAAARPEGTSRN